MIPFISGYPDFVGGIIIRWSDFIYHLRTTNTEKQEDRHGRGPDVLSRKPKLPMGAAL